ncbi:MAG: YifB family Mg chelatase-like AAA ATPase [Rickettsiales bacterium]|nr:YifB family Mg chelatase-like AAA ATPase [Rickettsiales bacterium]MCA0254535.1 YifB family Mg chelatase-like AAA ATPase [Pseudomonadota bacterium]
MITRISSLTFSGIEIVDVDVQVQIEPGIPKFVIVGLADKTIAESKERVRVALSSIGLALPAKKILINLAPADLLKEGSHFDLAISAGILASMRVLPREIIKNYLILGELSLDGTILPVSGVLPAAIGATARGMGIICAKQNGSEAAWSGNDDILAPANLLELVNHFKGTQVLSQPIASRIDTQPKYPDFKDIRGQKLAKRAIEIAAAGGHNLLMYGPPGAGKSMLAARLPGILPELTATEILECSTISSIAGHLQDGNLTQQRPFRAPHHTCTVAAMVGGGVGRKVKPGEISLAHNGVLFMDEFPEFPSGVIESLRQPLETREVFIARSGAHIRYPANFQLIAAMNPCKCGYLNDSLKACYKAPECASNYLSKISGPILDRFDLHIEVGTLENELIYEHMLKPSDEETSHEMAKRVKLAQEVQIKRYDGYNIKLNNALDGQLLIDYALPDDEGRRILNEAAVKFKLSMRAYNRVLRVARTIADLSASLNVKKHHISEALNYRVVDFYSLQPA